MKLIKLEAKGFKSFGEKVVINFKDGITAIVGPNGCGKSNVVDSMRWVLGEQRARILRSDKMENIIFNGTKNRKPLQMAEVSLTFSNTKNVLPIAYSEVTITRRLYRSGDSEYLLNGVACRLKDINNLFMDTGIGPDSYAIIELKMVDDILNDRENARRILFEEAAGISKFKIRKKETISKLSQTDADLERVQDVLFEIEKNLKDLEKQAKQAQKYQELQAEYKKISIELAKTSAQQLAETKLRLKRQIQTLTEERGTYDARIAEAEATIQQAKIAQLQAEQLLSSRQKTLNAHIERIRQFESEKKVKNERLNALKEKQFTLSQQIEQAQQTAAELQVVIAEKQTQKAELTEQVAELMELVAEKKLAYENANQEAEKLRQDLQQANTHQRNVQNEVYQLRKSLEVAQAQLNSLRQELERTYSEDAAKSAELQQFEKLLAQLNEELYEKKQQWENLKNQEEQQQKNIEDNLQATETLRQTLAEITRQLDAKQNEFNLTKSLVDSLEGFPEAIKFLKKHPEWNEKIPLLSDILTCQAQYRAAIENYLDSLMNYYVVADETTALQGIRILKTAQKGKAHFILQNQEKQPISSATVSPELIAAMSIVEYDPQYEGLMQAILGNVFIATQENSTLPYPEATVISLDGSLIRKKMTLSGGSLGAFDGKRIGRAKNLEKLAEDIEQLTVALQQKEEQLQVYQNQLQQLKSQNYRKAIEQLQQEMNTLQQQITATRTKQEQFAEMLRSNANRRESLLEKQADLQHKIEEYQQKEQKAKIDLAAAEQAILDLNEKVLKKNYDVSQKMLAYNEQNQIFYAQQNQLNAISQEISFQENNWQQNKSRAAQQEAELLQTQAAIQALMQTSEVGEDELLQLYEEQKNIEQGVAEAEKEYYAWRGKNDYQEKEIRELQRRKEQSAQLFMEVQSKQNEVNLHLNNIIERVGIEFNIEIKEDEILDYEGSLYTEEQLKEKVKDLRQKMEKIGPINSMAMEAYKEIKERYDFIVAQREDLIQAKQSLLQTIEEIDAVAKENFLNTFTAIRENFMRVFRSLFTEEDTCDLRLVDENNPLDSAIDIIARPKGKRPLTINQLSGGEKTLTATALLFSIYLIKPAPFCVFDEVDAPLDDANVDKFNKLIRKFSENSQFIIVTHNKRTMASTDVIYGVTMLEEGVSCVIPVDIKNYADE